MGEKLTSSAVAQILNISRSTLYHWVEKKLIPCERDEKNQCFFDSEIINRMSADQIRSRIKMGRRPLVAGEKTKRKGFSCNETRRDLIILEAKKFDMTDSEFFRHMVDVYFKLPEPVRNPKIENLKQAV